MFPNEAKTINFKTILVDDDFYQDCTLISTTTPNTKKCTGHVTDTFPIKILHAQIFQHSKTGSTHVSIECTYNNTISASSTIVTSYQTALTENHFYGKYDCANKNINIVTSGMTAQSISGSITYIPYKTETLQGSTTVASSTLQLVGTTTLGFSILITIAFIYLTAYLYNSFFKKKPWLNS